MAVDLMNISGVEQVESQGQSVLNNLSALSQFTDVDDLVDKVIADLKNKIAELKRQEAKFLTAFPECHGDINEFKRALSEYYNQYNLMTFTGSSLGEIVKEFQSLTNQERLEYANTIETLINNVVLGGQVRLRQELIDAFKNEEVTNAFKEEIISIVLNQLSGYGVQSNSGLTSIKFASITPKNNTSAKGALTIAASATTKGFKEHLEAMEKEAHRRITSKTSAADKQKILHARALLKGTTSTQISGNQLTQTFSINWFDAIASITKDKSGKASDIIDPKKIGEINDKITNLIISKLNLSGDMESFTRKLIYNEILSKNDKAFFIGKSFTQLEGILGEISAVLALTKLLGDKHKHKIMDWVGSQSIKSGQFKGKQPSIDIVLKDIMGMDFGIQVKNTVQDLKDGFLHSISFAGGSLNKVLERLGIQDENIKDLFFSDEFNVPFKKRGPAFIQVDRGPHHTDEIFPHYVDLDISIDDITAQINNYFLMYASDFLYMGIDGNFKSKLAALDEQITGSAGGNFVYIVGPKVFFASEMLTQLQQELEQLQDIQNQAEQLSFQVTAYIEKLDDDIGDTYNIVSVLNGRSSRENITRHAIKLKSSWKFKG